MVDTKDQKIKKSDKVENVNIENEKIKNLIKIRNISHIFYLFSFVSIVVVFIIYLYSSKTNRSCQYGSTLFCNTETKYPIKETSEQFNELIFKEFNGEFRDTIIIKIPISDNKNYELDYYFKKTGGDKHPIKTEPDIGVSYFTSGASIYFSLPKVATIRNNLIKITSIILNTSPSGAGLNFSEDDQQFSLIYNYQSTNIMSLKPIIISPEVNNMFSETQITQTVPENYEDNMIILLQINKSQEKNCDPGSGKNDCICLDPSYVPQIKCSDYTFQPERNIYCPHHHPDCTLCTSDNLSHNCGFHFCNPSSQEDPSSETFEPYSGSQSLTGSFYQNSNVPKVNKSDSSKFFVGSESLLKKLGSDSIDDLKNYASYQPTKFCGGNSFTTNNFNNVAGGNPQFNTTNSNAPLFARYPRWEEGKNFDF